MIAISFWEDRNTDPIMKYTPGDSIPDDHPKREWLLRSKIAVVDPDNAGEPEIEVADEGLNVDPDNAGEPEIEVADEGLNVDPDPVDEPVAEPAPAKNRPSRTAGIDDWRAFAKTKGVETKNLSKQEIIAATQ